MHDQENGTPSGDRTPQPVVPSIPSTEATRRELYDEVVATHFNPSPEEVQRAAEDPENHWVPDYGPEAAGLAVFKVFGRWVAVWRSLEVGEDQPEALRWTVLRIVREPQGPDGGPAPLQFLEV
jgi:hypothetical protein